MSFEKMQVDRKCEEVEEIEVPDGGYGWIVTIAVFLYNFCTWGANAGYAIYLEHYLRYDTFPGGGRLDYAAVGGIAFGVGLLFAPFITWVSHRFGVHVSIAIGIVFQGTGLMLAAFSRKLWQIYLTQGVLISFGLAFIFVPNISLLPQWFRRKRSLASGVAAGGSGLGGVIFNLGMQRIIEVKSVKWALIVQFIMCTCLSSIALTLTRTRRQAVFKKDNYKIKLFDKEVFSSPGAWLVCGWVSFTMLGYVILLYSLSAFTTSLGYSPTQGSYVSCMISVGNIIGRPIVGYLADMFGSITVGVVVHLVVAIFSWAMWIPCKNMATAIVFALIEGMLMGSIWVLLGSIVTRVVGLRKLDVTFGALWIFVGIFSLPSPVIGIQLASSVQNATAYVNTAIFSGFCYFGASSCLFLLRGYLVARDAASDQDSLMDNDEVAVPVSFYSFSKGLITLRSSKKSLL
ncbi:hypothetical protein HG535_0C05630 [Zygotorulaspora mrakii]|uniref:Major facilitator superfamily (MFS) profile domain-containing protein n=1 Tax=Zygotorulaspora mrakii TaxID=42260 RepID=A0A7H9B2K3_ZYGMR|nr:uncharacterized protein HG535_0C05630 [Zygotorulaspora mrakii]QLG72209.1 hypothetical protein HG535_0C05630 [Zygotorulaspora mrakii]